MFLRNQALIQLEAFRSGQKKLSEVIEVEEFARFMAISDLLQCHHASVWKSLRFYYNPITTKLHPIGFDGHLKLTHFIVH